MKNKSTRLDRRKFMKVSAAAGGGIVLSFHWLSCKPETELAKAIPAEWYDMNAYLKIGDTGLVTIVSPNPEIGQNVKTSMPMIVAEELGCNWRDVVVEQAPLTVDFNRQVAGGSQSIRSSWDNLRKAGATVRHMMTEVAAKEWEVDASECTVQDGIISHSSGKSIGFGEVASAASKLEIPEDVKLKDPKDYTIIGTNRVNVDIDKIITGKPLFGIDTREEGMQYASVIRPPSFGQSIASFDAAEAKSQKGVSDVVKFEEKIAVIGDSNWSVMKAKKLVKVEWKTESKAENSSDHDAALNKILENPKGDPMRNDGDVEKAFAEADMILERVYEAPFLPHNCLEPMNFYAHVKGDKVITKGPIQTPKWTQDRMAKKVGLETENVQVDLTRMGGGFGRRLYGDFAEEAAQISQLVGTPIQLLWSREDDMTAGTYRPASKYKIKAGVKDGKLTAYQLTEACINGNMFNLIPHYFPAGCVDNYQVRADKLESNITTGAWRAPYTNFLASAEQSFIDELAAALEVDAVQFRLDLLKKLNDGEDEKIEYSGKRMADVIKLAAEKSGWSSPKSGSYLGMSAYYSHNTHVAEVAEVVLEDDRPVVKKVYCAVDCGIVINPLAAKNQIEGGIIDGIGHAMYGDLKFSDGAPSVNNFDRYRLIRSNEAPDVEVYFVENTIDPTGLGEPSLPPAGGAVANAIAAATGKRFYKQPFMQYRDVIG